MVNTKKASGLDYLCLALTAFLGLGMEALLAFMIEPWVYGRQMQEWTTGQTIIHWILTCFIWGLFAFYIIKKSRQYGYDLFQKTVKIKLRQWILAGGCVVFCLAVTWMDWNGSKVLQEFVKQGMPKFIFQYIYYLFEVVLFMLIIVYGQKAFEVWFRRPNIPYGGIAVAITWGLAHWGTKGSFYIGIYSAVAGFCFGVVYLLLNRNIKLTYLALCIMFIL